MNLIHLTSLAIVNFRNIQKLELEAHKRFNIVSGKNGMGKTNLLEAIYMFGVLRSFRTTTRADLLKHGQPDARIKAEFGGAAAGMECEITINERSRRVRVDGKSALPGGAHFSKLPMVLFHPATMSLVQGGPDARRRFLNRALFQANSAYPIIHRDYTKTLASRNRLLKQLNMDPALLATYDDQLANLGTKIVEARQNFIEDLAPLLEEAFKKISVGLEGKIEYRPKVEADEEVIKQRLKDRLAVDRARGFTTTGPHADDIDLSIKGMAAKKFGSQGQQRMLVLAMKIAETKALTKATGRIPILLLDDVSSELDRERNRHLFEFLSTEGGQVFITTTHLDHILIDSERADFEVQEGVVYQK